MKRYIKNTSIFGMALNRKDVLTKLSALSEDISVHVIKCVVYHDTLPESMHHWISELSAWFAQASRYKCKSKLKAIDYAENLFGAFGETLYDADANLTGYQILNAKSIHSERYPDFEVTPELIDKVFKTYQAIIDETIPIFLSGQSRTSSEWAKILEPIFN